MSSFLNARPRHLAASLVLGLLPCWSWAMDAPVDASALPATPAEVLRVVPPSDFVVQDETSSNALVSMPGEAEWLSYLEMHEQLSGSAARSLFMPWFSLQQQAN